MRSALQRLWAAPRCRAVARTIVAPPHVRAVRMRSDAASGPDAAGAALAPLFRADSATHARLLAPRATRRRVAIVGAAASGTREVVDALLAEPVDAEVMRVLRALPRGAGTQTIRYGAGGPEPDAGYSLPLRWLRDAHVDIVEMVDPAVDAATLNTLYACDQVFFVTHPAGLALTPAPPVEARQTLELLTRLAAKPHTSVLVNMPGTAPITPLDEASAAAALNAALGARVTAQLGDTPVRLIASALAMQAKTVLAGDNAAAGAPALAREPRDWLAFSQMYSDARFTTLHAALEQPVALDEAPTFCVAEAREVALAAEAAEGARLDVAAQYAKLLRSHAEREVATMRAYLLPTPDSGSSSAGGAAVRAGDASASVQGSLADSQSLVRATLARFFAWWRLPWHIDGLRAAVVLAVSQSFGTAHELRLAYEAGRLRGIAHEQVQQTREALTDLARRTPFSPSHRDAVAGSLPPLDSATMRNAIASFDDKQLGAILGPSCLVEPLVRRRHQLLSAGGPVDTLVQRARRAVLQVYVGLGSSYALCALGAVTRPTAGTAAAPATATPASASPSAAHLASHDLLWRIPDVSLGILGDYLHMAPSTAASAALLATAAAAWFLQGRWARAKRAFWADWDRTTDAVERDEQVRMRANY